MDGGPGRDIAIINHLILTVGEVFNLRAPPSWLRNVEAIAFFGGSGDDTVTGGDYLDQLDGGAGDDTLYAGGGTGGVERLTGGAGRDKLYGGSGDDVLDVDEYDLVADGGSGNFNQLWFRGESADMIVDISSRTGSQSTGTLLILNITALNYEGGSGVDTVTGGADFDYILGGGGADILYGGGYGDFMFGSDGDDFVYGQDGRDILRGDAGKDMMYGGADNDGVAGGNGDDILYGEAGDDVLDGGINSSSWVDLYIKDGSDELHGGAGSDSLWGGGGADVLHGDDGNDLLSGGGGKDTLFGGEGADMFRFRQGESRTGGGGRDVIADFEVGVDKIDLVGLISSFSQLTFQKVGGGLIVYGDVAGYSSDWDFAVQLTGVTSLSESDFVFAYGAAV